MASEYLQQHLVNFKIDPEIQRHAALVLCGRAEGVEDAKMLLDVVGLVQQPPGAYASSDEELIARGWVCDRGHPMNRENRTKTYNQRETCAECRRNA